MESRQSFNTGRLVVFASAIVALLVAAAIVGAWLAPWEIAVGNLILRSQPGMVGSFPPPQAGDLVTASRRDTVSVDHERRPTNVILMIGDGMGIGQISAASALLHGPDGGLAMESASVTGLVRVHAGNDLATDSAAASTAMSTGFKAHKTAISTLSDGSRPLMLFELAKRAGMATGVVTTSGLADATPAGFLVHADDRYQYAEILRSILDTDHDVLVGGSWVHHHRAKRDDAYVAMIADIDELGTAAGFSVVQNAAGLAAATAPVLAILPPRGDSSDGHGPALAVTTGFAIDALAVNERGFLAVVESELTDGGGHRNDIGGVADAIEEFDDAVKRAVDWAAVRGDTLVLVTADHDTGGVGIIGGSYDDGLAEIRWASDRHTAQWVPIFAFGPGAGHFNGVIDNTDIAIMIAKLLGFEGFPQRHP